jgi:hypothetical protein
LHGLVFWLHVIGSRWMVGVRCPMRTAAVDTSGG